MKDSKAIKIYVSNIMTEPGQTDNYSLADHIKAIIEHTGKNVIDYCIYDTGEIIPEYIKRYNLKGSELVAQDVAKARTFRSTFITKGFSLCRKWIYTGEGGYHSSPVLLSPSLQKDRRADGEERIPTYRENGLRLRSSRFVHVRSHTSDKLSKWCPCDGGDGSLHDK